jgi:long-chain acyl-CoA synthetase
LARSSIAELVGDFQKRGSEVAFVFQRGYRTARWTYAEVASLAERFCAEFQRRGVRPGDRIIFLGPNSAEWVAAFLGCALLGAVAVPLDRASSPEFVRKIIEQVDPVLALCDSDSATLFERVAFILFDQLDSLLTNGSSTQLPKPPSRNDILEIIFTSGTTADPKGVVITQANVLANLEPLEREIAKYSRYAKLVHPLRFLNLLPLSHVFGQFLSIFVPQALGATVVFQESLNPAEIIDSIHRRKVNVCIAVPHMLSALREHIEREYQSRGRLDKLRRDLQRVENKHFVLRWLKFRRIHSAFGWRFWAFISGGSALSETDESFWNRLAFAVIQGYGLTETTSLVSVNHPFQRSKRSIGKMLPGRQIKLAEDGEILVRGENVATNYWQSHRLMPMSARDEWFATGDIGEIDAAGNLYFKGRKKNVIVTHAGMNVYPEDLEDALRRQPGVRDAAVIGLAADGNEEPFAVLLLNPGASAESAIERANQSLAEYQRIHRHLVWPDADFPRTPTQKPLIKSIEQYVLSHGAEASHSGVEELMSRLSRDPRDSSNSKLQLSSMQKVELMSALENKYQVDLSEVEFSRANTVQDLDQLVRQSAPNMPAHLYPRWPRRWPFTWIRTFAYWLFASPATMILAKPRVVGAEYLRKISGPLLIVCNHITMVDIGFVVAALPPKMRTSVAPAMQGEMLAAMRTSEASLPLWRRLLSRFEYFAITALFNVFPLPQRSALTRSFAFAGENIEAGYSVLVFPEGRRTQDGKLSRFQSGIGILATRLQVQVLPMRIDGLFEAARSHSLFVKPGRITVRIGAPIRYEPSDDPESVAKDLERRVGEL